ncbi:unnamed protein product [Parnassius apollo]|uniref:(apollo) hypothetical protein n=1 Tax=Parnassius apollo TaxID=110799 RepID=A0A8S3WK08_PARAO|nr:unnamed protein product [Parnassius apollo]
MDDDNYQFLALQYSRPSQRVSRAPRKTRASVGDQLADDRITRETVVPRASSLPRVSEIQSSGEILAEEPGESESSPSRPYSTQLEQPTKEEDNGSSTDDNICISTSHSICGNLSGLTITIKGIDNDDDNLFSATVSKTDCKNCQCHKKNPCLEPQTVQAQMRPLDRWSSQIETDEIKGYLRSLCRNCQCGKTFYPDPQCATPQRQSSNLWSSQNQCNDLRGYLQSTWRNCQCSKSRPCEETVNMSGTVPPTQTQVIQNWPTQVASEDIKPSMLSNCKNCQCVRRKLFLGSNSVNNHISPKLPFEVCQNPECIKDKSCPEASTLVSQIEKSALSETTCPNPECLKDIPRDQAAVPKELAATSTPPMFESSPLQLQKETQEEKDAEESLMTPEKQSRNINKRVSTSTSKKTRYNSAQLETIQAHESEPRRSIEEVKKNRAADRERQRSSHMKSDALPDDSRPSRTRTGHKKVSDVSQSFPEKLSRAIGKGDTDTNERSRYTNPCSYRRVDPEVEQPQGCVPYKPPEEDNRDKCFPNATKTAQKRTYTPQAIIPEKLPRTSERRPTVESKVKRTSEPHPKLESLNDPLQDPRKSVRISEKTSPTAPTYNKLRTKIVEVKQKDSKTKHICECKKGKATKKDKDEKRDSTSCECRDEKGSNSTDCACSSSAHENENAQNGKLSKNTSSDKYQWPKKLIKAVQPRSSKQKLQSSSSLEKQPSPQKLPLDEKPSKLSSIEEKSQSLEDKSQSLEKNQSDRRSSSVKKQSPNQNEEKLSQLKSSQSDSISSKQKLRSSSNESRPSRQARRSSRDERPSNARHKSAPGEYRPTDDTQREVRPSKQPTLDLEEIKLGDSITSEQESVQIPHEASKHDAAVEIRCPICTCATQCHSTSCYQHTAILSKTLKENIYEDIPTPDYTFDDDETLFSDFTSDEKSDTTVQSTRCNHVAVEFCDKLMKTKKTCKTCCGRLSKEPLKRNNQATTTDKTKFKDVSTVTKDWWSPMCEKKYKKPCSNKKKYKKTSDKCISTDGRLVTFRSRTQLIPTCCRDVLSPSRYLLESQRQYNEIFTSKFFGNTVYPALVHHHKQGGFCASKIKRNSQRGHKTKRLEDFSPRQQLPASPKISEEHARSDDTTRPALRYVKGLRRYKHRTDAKSSFTRKPRFHKPGYENGAYKILRKSQRNLSLRYVPAEDKISLSGQCNSASSF